MENPHSNRYYYNIYILYSLYNALKNNVIDAISTVMSGGIQYINKYIQFPF